MILHQLSDTSFVLGTKQRLVQLRTDDDTSETPAPVLLRRRTITRGPSRDCENQPSQTSA